MELLKDMHRFGPAPTWQRETAAAAANLVFTLVAAGALLIVFQRPVVAMVLTAVMFVWIVGRLVLAARGRDRREVSR